MTHVYPWRGGGAGAGAGAGGVGAGAGGVFVGFFSNAC